MGLALSLRGPRCPKRAWQGDLRQAGPCTMAVYPRPWAQSCRLGGRGAVLGSALGLQPEAVTGVWSSPGDRPCS